MQHLLLTCREGTAEKLANRFDPCAAFEQPCGAGCIDGACAGQCQVAGVLINAKKEQSRFDEVNGK